MADVLFNVTVDLGTGGALKVPLTGYLKANGAGNLWTASASVPHTDVSGLGTAATQNTGTSGANVPLLNGNNTHSGTNAFQAVTATTVSATTNVSAGGAVSVAGNIHGGNSTFNTSLNPGNSRLSHLPGSPVSVRQEFGTDGTGWQYRIATNNAGTVVDRVTVADNGNVGIGVATPDRKLVVNGDIALMYSDGNSYNGVRLTGVKTEYFNGITGSPSFVIHDFTGSGGVSKFSITEGGDVASAGTASFAGAMRATQGDALTSGFIGATKAVRIIHDSAATYIEGVDPTLNTSYQPLELRGSTLTLAATGGTVSVANNMAVTGAATATTTVEAGTSLLVTDVYQLAAVSSASQTRTVDLSENAAIEIEANQGFTLNASGPSLKSGKTTLYIYNSSGSGITVLQGTGWFSTYVFSIPAGTTFAYSLEWDGRRMQVFAAQSGGTGTGDKRPLTP